MNPNKEFAYPDGSIHLHRIDGRGVAYKPFGNEIVVTREHAKGDVAVREAPLLFALSLG